MTDIQLSGNNPLREVRLAPSPRITRRGLAEVVGGLVSILVFAGVPEEFFARALWKPLTITFRHEDPNVAPQNRFHTSDGRDKRMCLKSPKDNVLISYDQEKRRWLVLNTQNKNSVK